MAKENTKPVVASSFSLAGFIWKVRYLDGITEYGLCNPATQEIIIRAGMSKQMTEQTFYHELTHAILFTMGKTNHDEEFTDIFGSLLHQFVRTKE